MVRAATSWDSIRSSMMERSGRTNSPPLKPAMGVSIRSGSISMAIPFGGRPLVMAKRMPDSRSRSTARRARSVSTLSCVTSVPSTSARSSEILGGLIIGVPPASMSPDRQPSMSIAMKQSICRVRPRASSGIIRKVVRRPCGPGIENGLHGAPGCLDRVCALEQHRIADQAVVDQRLVADGRQRLKIVAIREIHGDAVDLNVLPGTLGTEAHGKALIGLEAQG